MGTIVTDGLVGCWDVASARSSPGGGTTWTDLSKNGNDGTLTNGPTVRGDYGGVVEFDGTDDYVSFSSLIMPGISQYGTVDQFTISVWVKWDHFSSENLDEIISWWETGSSGSYHDIFLGSSTSTSKGHSLSNPHIRFGDDWQSALALDASVDTGVWINLVAIKTSNNAYIYKNGVLASTKGSALSAGFNANPSIGRHPAYAEYFPGSISNVYIYNRALTAAEIKQNYYATKGRFDAKHIHRGNLELHLDAGDLASYDPSVGGNWSDISGNSRSVTNAGITFDSTWPKWFGFDGTNDYVSFGSKASGASYLYETGAITDGPPTFTWEMWMRRTGSQTQKTLFRVDDWSRSEAVISNNELILTIGYGSSTDSLTHTVNIIQDEWYHLCFVYEKLSEQSIYINGSLAANRTPTVSTYSNINSTAGDANLGKGHSSPYGTYFLGDISIVRYYSTNLSSTIIDKNYNAEKWRFV